MNYSVNASRHATGFLIDSIRDETLTEDTVLSHLYEAMHSGADSNVTDSEGMTLLHFAI